MNEKIRGSREKRDVFHPALCGETNPEFSPANSGMCFIPPYAGKQIRKLMPLAFVLIVILTGCKEHGKSSESAPVDVSGNKIYSDSAASSVKVFDQNGRVCIQQSNTFYEMTDAYEGPKRIPLLLKIKKTELCYADSINKSKVYEISAKSVLDTKSVDWNIQFVGTNLVFDGNTLLATYDGGDQHEDFNRRFNLLTGKEVFSSSYGELVVKIPNVREKRFVGFTSKKAITDPIGAMREENLFGVIRFGSSIIQKDALKLILKRSKIADKISASTPDMIFVSSDASNTVMEDGKVLVLMKADEHYTSANVSNFSVQFTFYYGDDNESTTMTIPIVNDKFDLAHAKYDKDIFELAPFKDLELVN